MQKISTAFIALVAVLAFALPNVALAEDVNCVTVYGQGVVCGKRDPEFKEPVLVDAGVGDVIASPAFIGGAMLAVSGAFYVAGKKVKATN